MITWAEVISLLRTVLRWWWVVVLAVVISGGSAFLVSRYERRYYMAHTTLAIGNQFGTQRPDQNAVQLNMALANFYAELARRERILKPVQEQLGLTFDWRLIADEMLRTNVVGNTGWLEIYITDTNPDRAAAIANTIAVQLIAYSPTSPEKIEAERKVVEAQIAESGILINDLQQRIAETTEQQQRATSASDLTEINATLTQLQNSLQKEQDRYNSLLVMKSSSVANSLSVFEEAVAPTFSIPSKRNLMIAVASFIGFLIAILAVFILDRLDTRWSNGREPQMRFSMHPLGTLAKGPPILASLPPLSVARHEAVRNVQSSILLRAGERGLRTLLVTSPKPSRDRTALSIDLANLFARSGQRVLLVDADPVQSDLTRSMHAFEKAQPWHNIDQQNGRVWTHLVPTPITNVALLPANGGTTGEPSMLSSPRWQELVRSLGQLVDIVIFDGPSVMIGPDAALVAPHVDGIILALDAENNSRSEVVDSRNRLLHQPNVRLLGAVMLTPGMSDTEWRLPDHRNPELPDVHPSDLVSTRNDIHDIEAVVHDPDDDESRVIITPTSQPEGVNETASTANRSGSTQRSARQRRSGVRQRDRNNK